MNLLHIRQDDPIDDIYPIRLTLRRDGQPHVEAEAKIEFTFTDRDHEELRWYLEDYLQRANTTEAILVQQVEAMMKSRGEELYTKVLAANQDTQAIWFSIRNELADLRIEISSGIAEAASIPWELMRDPKTDSPLSLRVKSFVRVQSNPNISFVSVPSIDDGRIRLLYVACRPGGANDVELRAVANRLLQDLGPDQARFEFKALRPPTFERLQTELADAKEAGRPYHVVHFDGHGVYADFGGSNGKSGKRGYVIFEHPTDPELGRVDGLALGRLLHDSGVPVLVLNACQSAMHEAVVAPAIDKGIHDEVRAIGSLAQGVIDEGIPAVLGMRYSVYVVTAAEYIGQLYAALAKGRGFGQAATEGRKHLERNRDRWVGLQPRPLQDWCVPVVYEAAPLKLLAADSIPALGEDLDLDPVQRNRSLLRHVPEEGFVGRDETLFALDRAFDNHRIVLLHAYAGQGKSTTAVEFARWYSTTGGLGKQPIVLLASFERHTDLDDLLNQIGQPFTALLAANGIHWSAVNDPEQRRKLVLSLLRQFPILWIWDNVEPVAGFPEGNHSYWSDEEQQDLRDFLKQIKLDPASKVKILLTSRRDEKKWLGGIPHRIAMPRMRNSDAARLAMRLGQERNIKRSEIHHWQPLLDYCAGNPLTLRVLVGQAVGLGLRGTKQIADFVESIRSGEQKIEDVDENEGRDKSLGASLDYGFRNAFKPDELPIIGLLHLFQGSVDVHLLLYMGIADEYALPELQGKTKEQLVDLLNRARETGLLTHLGQTRFTIHPALPWFLAQVFDEYYDGRNGHSTRQAALRAWVEAIGDLGNAWLEQYTNERISVPLLELDEANLLQARRCALKNGWWIRVISCMQGLRVLYMQQGRTAEWARLVEEIRPYYCTEDDDPVAGTERDYSVVMDYRVRLALEYEHNLSRAAALEGKVVEWNRLRTADFEKNVQFDALQRNRFRTLAVSLETLGNIRRQANDPTCLECYQEGIQISKRIGDKREEAVLEFNLGHAYLQVPDMRDLDAAEAAYRRSLNLEGPDNPGYPKSVLQIGVVHYDRFHEAQQAGKPAEVFLASAVEAEKQYQLALQLTSNNDYRALAPIHNRLGNLYSDLGQFDSARYHFERDIECEEEVGNRFGAGQTRYHVSIMYYRLSEHDKQKASKQANLTRALAYAEAAVRDFQYYKGNASAEEAQAQRVIEVINQEIASLG